MTHGGDGVYRPEWRRWVLMPWFDVDNRSELVAWKPVWKPKSNCFSIEWRWKVLAVLDGELLKWECRGPYMEGQQFESKKEAQDLCEKIAVKLTRGGKPGG